MKQFLIVLFLFSLLFSCKKDERPYVPTPVVIKKPNKIYADMIIPADNPITEEGVLLGRRLFYDPILSSDSTMGCFSCHKQEFAFTDGLAMSKGVTGEFGKRSSMSLVDVGFFDNSLFWDGRSPVLEDQALRPVEDPIELHHKWPNLVEKLKRHPTYPDYFRKAFGIKDTSEITKELAAKAIAQFERTIVSTGVTKYDQYRNGNVDAFDDDELDGYYLFFNASSFLPDAQCGHCHSGALLSDNRYLNNGIDSVGTLEDFIDKGYGVTTGNVNDNGRFRVPTLRNVMLTAPYMHDGRFKTIDEVMDHYISGGHYATNVDPIMNQLRAQKKISKIQRNQVIAFLKTLTDTALINNPAYKNPFK